MRTHSEIRAVAVLAALLFLPLGATSGSAQVAGLSAPGQPYVDCTHATERYDRLNRGLGVQRDAIRRTEALLAALREERTAGTKEARDQLMERTLDTLESHAADQLELMKELREKALALPTPADATKAAARLKWMEQVSTLQNSVTALQALANAFEAGQAYGTEVQRGSHTVAEHLRAANKLFVDSGLAESIGGELAKAGGPVGVAAFEGSLSLLDHLVAEQSDWDRLLEEQRAADNLNRMTGALNNVEEKMANLVQDCPAQFGRDTSAQTQASTSLTPPPSTPEPPAPSTAKTSGKKGGKAAVVVIGAGAAAAAGIMLGKAAGDLAAMSSGSGGACASNRFCIVSVLSSGCSCSGSVHGGCDWTGTVVPAGGSCGGGAPCQSGYSCNNGRCEGSGGRCPF